MQEHKQGEGSEEEGEADIPLSREHNVDSIPGPHNLSWRQTLNPLSYPGTPKSSLFLKKFI